MDWQEEYKSKMVSPKEAVKLVKSGDRVEIASAPTLESALGARAGELNHVVLRGSTYRKELPWFQPGWQESFIVQSGVPPMLRGDAQADVKLMDHMPPALTFLQTRLEEERALEQGRTDVFMVTLSGPDKHGYCSFGSSLLAKKTHAKRANIILAEVSELPGFRLRTGGDNYIHVSEIDRFVQHVPASQPRAGRLGQRELTDIDMRIANHVAELIRDGDTIEIGIGSVAEALPLAGVFQNKRDLGLHTGTVWKGLVGLVQAGIFTGARKTLHQGKVVTSAIQVADGAQDDLELVEFIDHNPTFELYAIDYVHDFKTIAAHDNFVAINSALAVDLAGQITTESIGSRTVGGAGGFPAFAMGALLSRGGRSITVMTSTVAGGTVSRIMPFSPANTMITLPRYFADYIVTEYGVASLMGKTQRERMRQLIGIAHPDFRSGLEKDAQMLF